ncbi:MAG: hypothetical protein WDO69_15580 [Pseudomonadota bacterium]
MGSTPALRAGALLLLAWALVTACTVTTNDSNDPNASQCRLDDAVVCPGNFVGYSCQGVLKPSPTCGTGTVEADGETGYCCGVDSTDTCVVDTAAGCTDGSTGYSCTGGVLPGSGDPSLSCGTGVAGPNGDALYCCIGVTSSSCSSDSSVTGCTGGSYGFSCASTDTPTQGNAALDCSTPAPGPDGSSLYCCVGFSGSTGSCTPDSSVAGCTGSSFGFSCTSSDAPDQTQPSLLCSTATPGPHNESLYCCSNN